MEGKKLVVSSSLQVNCRSFNEEYAQVTIVTDVTCGDTEFKQVELLRLNIDWDGDTARVMDEYFPFIPYPKPIPRFRGFMMSLLSKYANHEDEVIKRGLIQYLQNLGGYSDTKGIINEARKHANMLLKDDKKGAEKMAREMLKVMGVTPRMEMEFEVSRK